VLSAYPSLVANNVAHGNGGFCIGEDNSSDIARYRSALGIRRVRQFCYLPASAVDVGACSGVLGACPNLTF